MSPILARALARSVFIGGGVTVLDLGAGLGQYGRFFQEHAVGQHINYIGVDGAESIEAATGNFVRFADLTDDLPRFVRSLPKVDWVMSLEVAEHVPRSGEARLLHALATLPRQGIILSWATPGQAGGGGGARHVNCQWASYVDCVMGYLGFDWDHEIVKQLGDRQMNTTYPCHWLRHNLMAFRRRAPSDHQHKKQFNFNHANAKAYKRKAAKVSRFHTPHTRAETASLRALMGAAPPHTPPAASAAFELLYFNISATRCELATSPHACACVDKDLICPRCSEAAGPREGRNGGTCKACDECARINHPVGSPL